MLSILSSQSAAARVKTCLSEHAGDLYRIDIEKVSMWGVNMLNLHVYKHSLGDECKLSWKPYIKPTSKHVPLSFMSKDAPGPTPRNTKSIDFH